MNQLALAAVLGGLVALSACGSDHEPIAAPTTTVTAEVTTTMTTEVTTTVTAAPSQATPTPTATPSAQETTRGPFPKGYPKVVQVSTLPDQVRSWYQGDYTKAVAVAPGVWTPLSPGATVSDAIASQGLDGFCGSIKAYERKYAGGQEHGGACW